MDTQDFLHAFGLDAGTLQAGGLPVRSPIDGALLADLRPHDADDAQRMIDRAHQAFLAWRQVPAPRRGELVRLLGEELRAHKQALGRLVTLEVGKIAAEGETANQAQQTNATAILGRAGLLAQQVRSDG